jgi:hypothetical protein
LKGILKKFDSLIKGTILLFPLGSPVYFGLSRMYYFLRFVYFYKRLPGDEKKFSDFLYQIKIGKSLRQPLLRQVTSKLGGKAFIRSRIGSKNLVKTIKVLSSDEDIYTFKPKQFPIFIKPNHSSGRFFKINSLSEYHALKTTFKQFLLHDYFSATLEENYYAIPKKIIVEAFIDPEYYLEGSAHCLKGKIKIISLIDRFDKEKKRESYDASMKPLGFSIGNPYRKMNLDKHQLFFMPKLKKSILELSKDFDYIRVDFYASNHKFLFGELTNLPAGGNLVIYPKTKEKLLDHVFFSKTYK